MPKAKIGTVSGVFLEPGVSKNKRLYRPGLIEDATKDMASRLADDKPITMMARHGTESHLEHCATIRNVWTDEAHRGHYQADIPDTAAGRDLLALTTPDSEGRRHLNSVSIYGGWLGDVQTIEHEGQEVVTGDKLLISRVDFTSDPGVEGARMDAPGATETLATIEAAGSSFTPISEAAPAAELFTDTAVREASGSSSGGAGSDSSKPYGDVTYADPGYQSDGKKRYPLDSAAHVRSALSYINQSGNAAKYSASQVASIKAKIKKAAKQFGIDVSAESASGADVTEAYTATETLAHALAAWEATVGISAMQGPADVMVQAFGIDNADVAKAAALIGQAAANALTTLDPDQDDDLDLPGDADGTGSDADDASGNGDGPVDVLCAACMSSVPDDADYCPSCGSSLSGESATVRPDRRITEMAPSDTAEASATTCPGCGANVAADAKYCPMCGAQTKQKGGNESSGTQEAPVSENDDLAAKIAAAVAQAIKPAEPVAAAPAEPAAPETASAATSATETAPAVNEGQSVADQIAEALATQRKADEDARAAERKELLEGVAAAVGSAVTGLRDEFRSELQGSGGAPRAGYGASKAERLAALPQRESKALYELPAHERDRAMQEYIAEQGLVSGVMSADQSEAVRTMSKFSA